MEIFDSYDALLKTYWYIAIPVSLIFLIQTALTFIGADVADGIEADFDSNLDSGDAPFQVFSFRNLINFLIGFSWSGISLYNSIENKNILIGVSVAVGLSFIFLFFVIMKQIQKLAEDNSFKITSTLNKTAEVYLTIPEKKSGKGKVLISINGAFHELDAITENEKITTGTTVKIIKIENDSLLLVETI
jgi:hypothetical protein